MALSYLELETYVSGQHKWTGGGRFEPGPVEDFICTKCGLRIHYINGQGWLEVLATEPYQYGDVLSDNICRPRNTRKSVTIGDSSPTFFKFGDPGWESEICPKCGEKAGDHIVFIDDENPLRCPKKEDIIKSRFSVLDFDD